MIEQLRHFGYRFKYRYGRHIPGLARVPVDVSLELSSDCNMKCEYCYHGDPARLPFTKGVMTYPTAIRIITQAADLGVNSLKMNWKGESTINPHFRDITTYAKLLAKGSTFIDRLTNSNFKFRTDREDIFEGLCNQTKVKISFDSFHKDVFETQRKGGDHSMTFRNIDKFYHHPMRVKSETQIVIQAVRTQANRDEDIAGQAKKLWPEATISIRDMVAGRTEKDVSAMEVRRRDPENRQSCQQAHVRLLFNYKGDAFPCCPDIGEKLNYGNIWNTRMIDLFQSEMARTLRKDLKSGKAFALDPCKGCSSFESFKGFKPSWNS